MTKEEGRYRLDSLHGMSSDLDSTAGRWPSLSANESMIFRLPMNLLDSLRRCVKEGQLCYGLCLVIGLYSVLTFTFSYLYLNSSLLFTFGSVETF